MPFDSRIRIVFRLDLDSEVRIAPDPNATRIQSQLAWNSILNHVYRLAVDRLNFRFYDRETADKCLLDPRLWYPPNLYLRSLIAVAVPKSIEAQVNFLAISVSDIPLRPHPNISLATAFVMDYSIKTVSIVDPDRPVRLQAGPEFDATRFPVVIRRHRPEILLPIVIVVVIVDKHGIRT